MSSCTRFFKTAVFLTKNLSLHVSVLLLSFMWVMALSHIILFLTLQD